MEKASHLNRFKSSIITFETQSHSEDLPDGRPTFACGSECGGEMLSVEMACVLAG